MPSRQPDKESARYATFPFLGGVDLLRATYVTHSFSRHFHEGYAVGCIEHGAMRFRYQGESLVAAQGEVNLVVPGEAHDGHAASHEGWSYRMFYLPPQALRESAKALTQSPGLPHFRAGVIRDPALAQCIRATHRALENPTVPALEKETRLLWLLAHWISRHADTPGSWPDPPQEHRAVALAREYLDARFAEDITLPGLARAAGLSPFHLLRVFERQLGVTPHDYLTQIRVERAREKLLTPARLADVALETGFADQSHLTRTFKKRYGVTPGRFRKIVQNS